MLFFLSAALLLLSSFALTPPSAYAAAVINNNAQPNLVLLSNPDEASSNALLNTSLSANETFSPPRNHLPNAPYYYHVPEYPEMLVIFYAFGRPIPEIAVVECMIGANQIVSIALRAALRDVDPDRVIPQREIRTDAQHASLVLTPIHRQLKWITCSAALGALRDFLNTWEFVGLTFLVQEEGVSVGVGELF